MSHQEQSPGRHTPHPLWKQQPALPARAQTGHLFPLRWHSAWPGLQQAAHEGLAHTGSVAKCTAMTPLTLRGSLCSRPRAGLSLHYLQSLSHLPAGSSLPSLQGGVLGGHESLHLFPREGQAQSLRVESRVFGSAAPSLLTLKRGRERSPG